MNNLRKILIIFGVCTVLVISTIVIYTKSYEEINVIKLNPNDIKSIILINNKIGNAKDNAKDITRIQDINSICELFNTTDMDIIKNWDGGFDEYGGNSFTFLFNLSDGTVKEVGYYNGSYLIVSGNAYRINSTKFESFWQLSYKERKYYDRK